MASNSGPDGRPFLRHRPFLFDSKATATRVARWILTFRGINQTYFPHLEFLFPSNLPRASGGLSQGLSTADFPGVFRVFASPRSQIDVDTHARYSDDADASRVNRLETAPAAIRSHRCAAAEQSEAAANASSKGANDVWQTTYGDANSP